MDLSNQLLGVDVLTVGVGLVVVLLEGGLHIEVTQYLRFLDLVKNKIDQLVLEKEF